MQLFSVDASKFFFFAHENIEKTSSKIACIIANRPQKSFHIRNLSEAPSVLSTYFVVQINFLYLTFDAKGGLILESL